MALLATTTLCACEHDSSSHAFIRCGCSYQGEHRDEKHPVDDAYHLIWCHTCLKYCSKAKECPTTLPQLCLTNVSKGFSVAGICLRAFAIPLLIIATARSWFFEAIGKLFWWKAPVVNPVPNEKQRLLM